MDLFERGAGQCGTSPVAELEGDVDGGVHVQDLQSGVVFDELIDEDADPAADGAPPLE